MKLEILDREIFSSIRPEALSRYLAVNGWQEVRRVEGELIVFSKDNTQGGRESVWMPINADASDYVSMVASLVKTASATEDKSELQIINDLQTVALGDIISLRTYDPMDVHSNTILLSDGMVLLARGRLMAVAAASSVVSRRAVHPRRPPAEASRFVRNLRLGQTEPGSYVIKLISPIVEEAVIEPEHATFDEVGERLPFSRRAVMELIRGLNALKQAAEDNRDRGAFYFNSFVSAVQAGVSANLCEAIISYVDDEQQLTGPVEVSITWSYAIDSRVDLPSAPIAFDPSVLPYIRRAAREFRARNPEVITLTGWVNILERDARSGPGLIRLQCQLDDRLRSVRIKLDPETYNSAIDAHKKGDIVSITGTLVVERGLYRLDNPTDFQRVEQGELFPPGEGDQGV